MGKIACSNCKQPYPTSGAPHQCKVCGGLYDWQTFPVYDPKQVELGQPGIWRYRQALGLSGDAPIISLGEGNTPLVWGRAFEREVGFKCEGNNPSGSFKDRGSAPIISFLCSRGVMQAVEDSSGNAGASFAAYMARSGMRGRVYVPEAASGPKRIQIEAYGAEVVRVPGPRSNAAAAVQKAAEGGATYASHAYLPFNLPGYATAAYELYEQLGGQAPGTVILPVGQGGLLLGLLRGFRGLLANGLIRRMPRLIGVQAGACAPLWALSAYGADGLRMVGEGATVAEGIRVRYPLRGDAALYEMEASNGVFMAVEEDEILEGRSELAHRGLFVEATSAVAWAALRRAASDSVEPIILMLTGSGLKSP